MSVENNFNFSIHGRHNIEGREVKMDMVVYGYGIVNGVHEVLMDKEM